MDTQFQWIFWNAAWFNGCGCTAQSLMVWLEILPITQTTESVGLFLHLQVLPPRCVWASSPRLCEHAPFMYGCSLPICAGVRKKKSLGGRFRPFHFPSCGDWIQDPWPVSGFEPDPYEYSPSTALAATSPTCVPCVSHYSGNILHGN